MSECSWFRLKSRNEVKVPPMREVIYLESKFFWAAPKPGRGAAQKNLERKLSG